MTESFHLADRASVWIFSGSVELSISFLLLPRQTNNLQAICIFRRFNFRVMNSFFHFGIRRKSAGAWKRVVTTYFAFATISRVLVVFARRFFKTRFAAPKNLAQHILMLLLILYSNVYRKKPEELGSKSLQQRSPERRPCSIASAVGGSRRVMEHFSAPASLHSKLQVRQPSGPRSQLHSREQSGPLQRSEEAHRRCGNFEPSRQATNY